jgi:hypothetical protein
MINSRKSTTASESIVKRSSDPECVARDRAMDARLNELTEILKKDEMGLLQDLRSVGVSVSSVWDLVNTRISYTAALPILEKHLSIPHHARTIEGIVRALSIREAKGKAAQTMLAMLRNAGDHPGEVRWALVNALTVTADVSMLNDLEAIAADVRYADDAHWIRKIVKKLRKRVSR